METMTTISLSTQTKDKLKTFGHKGESFDKIINKLMNKEDDRLLRELLMDSTSGMSIEEFREFVKND
jgi:predicted CopG family antitoxin